MAHPAQAWHFGWLAASVLPSPATNASGNYDNSENGALTNLAELQPEERAAEISSIAPGKEPEHKCRHCTDSGWCREEYTNKQE
jgi:hypothetical protein